MFSFGIFDPQVNFGHRNMVKMSYVSVALTSMNTSLCVHYLGLGVCICAIVGLSHSTG